MLTLYLENYTSFFEYLPSRIPYTLSKTQLRLFAAAVILRSLGQLVCNGHATLGLCAVEEEGNRMCVYFLPDKSIARLIGIPIVYGQFKKFSKSDCFVDPRQWTNLFQNQTRHRLLKIIL